MTQDDEDANRNALTEDILAVMRMDTTDDNMDQVRVFVDALLIYKNGTRGTLVYGKTLDGEVACSTFAKRQRGCGTSFTYLRIHQRISTAHMML